MSKGGSPQLFPHLATFQMPLNNPSKSLTLFLHRHLVNTLGKVVPQGPRTQQECAYMQNMGKPSPGRLNDCGPQVGHLCQASGRTLTLQQSVYSSEVQSALLYILWTEKLRHRTFLSIPTTSLSTSSLVL